MRSLTWALPVAAALALATATATGESTILDSGSFIVHAGSRTLGVETFSIESRGDSLAMFSQVDQLFPRASGPADSLAKSTLMVANAFDYGLRMYQSTQRLQGKKLLRAVVMDGDTTMSLYRENDIRGEGEKLPAPPGRMYIIDTQVFTLFDMICLSLHDQSFDSRPITLLVLGPRDSLVEARVSRLGTETIRWGARAVQAEKLSIGDDQSTFYAWTGRRGEMLRLSQPDAGLRVEREAPKVKRRPAPAPKPAG